MSTKNDNTEALKNFFNKKSKVAAEDQNVEYKPFAPTLPVVNIIPSSVKMRYNKEKIINRFAGLTITVAVLFLGIWGANFAISGVQTAVNNSIVDEISSLQGQVAEVEPFQRYLDGIELTRSNMAKVFNKNLDMGAAMQNISSLADSNNVTVTSLKISEATSTENNVCVTTDLFSSVESVGCVSISGISNSKDGVISFFRALNNVEGFTDAAIASIGVSGNNVTFTGTINLTQELYVNKFGYLTVPIDEVLKAGGLTDRNISSFVAGATAEQSGQPSTPSTQQPNNNATPTPVASPAGPLDPQYLTCAEAIQNGYGPYKKGVDFEYQWYSGEDTDLTGIACEAN